jgi:hypothetical protein
MMELVCDVARLHKRSDVLINVPHEWAWPRIKGEPLPPPPPP